MSDFSSDNLIMARLSYSGMLACLAMAVWPLLSQTSFYRFCLLKFIRVPLYLGDRAHVEVWLSELRNTTGILQFRFYNDQGTLVAEGHQRGLFVDTRTMLPRRLLPEERALFLPFLEEA